MKNHYWISLFAAAAAVIVAAVVYWLWPVEPMSERQIYNLTYPLHGYVAPFKNGRHESGDNPSEDGYSRAVISHYTTGDLDGDGDLDAGAIIRDDNGEIGSLTYLAVVQNETGAAKVLADPLILGDQVNVQGLVIHEGRIQVTLLPDATSASGKPITLQFRLEGGEVQEVVEAGP